MPQATFTLLRISTFGAGLFLVVFAISSVFQTFVVPRSADALLTRAVFGITWIAFTPWVRAAGDFERQDRVLGLFAPLALLMLPLVWLTCILFGYTGIFWALGVTPMEAALRVSGSSLLTLGFAPVDTLATTLLAFTEAVLGLALVALLIAYLPTMYTAFSQREAVVTSLEAYAGVPPSPVELISRTHRVNMIARLTNQWRDWENWFAQLEESHTSLAALVFFRSPQAHRSWITAAGVILDSAALMLSTVDNERDPEAALCLRAGYLALRRIAANFSIIYDPAPKPTDPISITREDYLSACRELAQAGVPLKRDLDQAWRDYAGWRVNYDTPLVALANLTVAPYARWTSDRCIRNSRPRYFSPTFIFRKY